MKDLHVWDLPHERVYVKLEENFQENLFLHARSKFTSWVKLAKVMDCNRVSLMNWSKHKTFIPLFILEKIASITETDFGIIEKKVVALATGRKTRINGKRGKPIYNTKFPIKLTPNLARVFARFMGDGCIKVNWYYDSIYFNKEEDLINAMIQDIKSVFGEMEVSISDDDGTKCVRFPSIVGLIIVNMFGEVGTLKAKIPQEIMNSTEDIRLGFLAAYFDDEGTVDAKHLLARYYTSNEMTSISLTKLLNSIGIKTGLGKTMYIARGGKKFIYHVNITGIENVKSFALKIKPLHKRKKSQLAQVLKDKQAFKLVAN